MNKLSGNKKIVILIASIVAVAIAAIVVVVIVVGESGGAVPSLDVPAEAANKPVKGELKVEVEKENLPEVPEKLNVYKLEQIAKNRKEIQELAGKFGITEELKLRKFGDGKPDDYDSYAIRQGDLGFKYFIHTGMIDFKNRSKYGQENPDIPSKDECIPIATEHLKRLGLLPEEAYISGTGGGQIREAERDGKPVAFYLHRTITFSRKIDGREIKGPGMFIDVSLGTAGELVGILSTMRNVVPDREYESKSVEEAIKDAQRGKGTMNLYSDIENPEVTRVELIYYADPAEKENKYLIPVYSLTGPDTCIYVPAIKQ